MNIKVNGENQIIQDKNVTISKLLQLNDVENPGMVTVQVNGEFVDKDQYDSTVLNESHEVEFLYFMGGGGY